jgi:membrane dipeptidase
MDPIPVFDGHNDTLLNLLLRKRGGGRDFFERSAVGHVDLPRALEGGFGGGFFACFAPPNPRSGWTEEAALTVTSEGYEVAGAPPLDPEYARGFADAMAKLLFRLEGEARASQGRQDGGRDRRLHRRRRARGDPPLRGRENLGPEPGALEELYDQGLRSLGLVWSRPNAYAHGVPFRFPSSPDTGPGLTDAGRELVRECNRLGVLIDLSHLNERGFWDVAGLSDAPLVATHSNAHALCPSSRNLTDRQLDAIRDSDGMVGVNFAVSFLREDGQDNADTPLSTVVRHVTTSWSVWASTGWASGRTSTGRRFPRPSGTSRGCRSCSRPCGSTVTARRIYASSRTRTG